MRFPRKRGSSRLSRDTEWARGVVMQAGRTAATCSDFPPKGSLLQAASRESRHESGRRAGRRHILSRTHPPRVLRASCTRGRPECREHTWDSPRFLLGWPINVANRHSIKRLPCPATRRRRQPPHRLRKSTFVQENTTAPKLALGPVVLASAPAINWQRVVRIPSLRENLLCIAIAVD